MIYIKLFLAIWVVSTEAHLPRRLQKQRVVCAVDDEDHCQDPTGSNIISCNPDTCAWNTDELDSSAWPSGCDTLDVTPEEIDQKDVPDWWEPCLLWLDMFGAPPPPPPPKDTDAPTEPSTDSPTSAPIDTPTPTSAPPLDTPSPTTTDSGPKANETVPDPGTPAGNGTKPDNGTPGVNQTKPDGENPPVSSNSTNTTTSDSSTVELDTLLLTYVFAPEVRRRLLVKLPVTLIANKTTEFLLDTLRSTISVTALNLEFVITQSLQWPNKTELVATTLSGQVVLPEATVTDQVVSNIYSLVSAVFANDAPEYVDFLQLSSGDAPALTRLSAVKSGMLPSELEGEGDTNTASAESSSSDESSWYQEPYFPAIIAGSACLILAILIGLFVARRNYKRKVPEQPVASKSVETVPQVMTTETGQLESDEPNDDDEELVSVLFDEANEARPVRY